MSNTTTVVGHIQLNDHENIAFCIPRKKKEVKLCIL